MTQILNVRNDSRYLKTKVLRDSNDVLYFDNWEPIKMESSDGDISYELNSLDLGRWDIMADQLSDIAGLWWVIPHVNLIEDPFSEVDRSDEDNSLDIQDTYSFLRYPEFATGTELTIPDPDVVRDSMTDAKVR